MKSINQFPHCDELVLHKPGSCKFCDIHPEWQQLREMYGINFTGEHDPAKSICPAEKRRPLENVHGWHGNVPENKETESAREKFYADLEKAVEEIKMNAYDDAIQKAVRDIMNDSNYKWRVSFEILSDNRVQQDKYEG